MSRGEMVVLVETESTTIEEFLESSCFSEFCFEHVEKIKRRVRRQSRRVVTKFELARLSRHTSHVESRSSKHKCHILQSHNQLLHPRHPQPYVIRLRSPR